MTHSANPKPYRVVVLNGTTSSGKSTLAAAVQERLSSVWLCYSLDSFLLGMPKRLTDINADRDEQSVAQIVGAFELIETAFREFVAAIVHSGASVIVDTVLHQGHHDVARWREVLPSAALWVHVTADEEIIRARESQRTDRVPGIADLQRPSIHRGVDYDLVVDTTTGITEQQLTEITNLLEPVGTKQQPEWSTTS